MTEQSTDSIRLAAIDQYIIDRENRYQRQIISLRGDRAILAFAAIAATVGMFFQFHLAHECLVKQPTPITSSDK